QARLRLVTSSPRGSRSRPRDCSSQAATSSDLRGSATVQAPLKIGALAFTGTRGPSAGSGACGPRKAQPASSPGSGRAAMSFCMGWAPILPRGQKERCDGSAGQRVGKGLLGAQSQHAAQTQYRERGPGGRTDTELSAEAVGEAGGKAGDQNHDD